MPLFPDHTPCNEYLGAGIDDPTDFYLCRDRIDREYTRVSKPNPFLQAVNSSTSYANHTVFYGDASQRSDVYNRQVALALGMLSFNNAKGDGVVPISSACRLGSSTGTVPDCTGSPFKNLIDTEFTHTEIKNAPNMPAYTAELLRVADTLLDIDDGTLDGNRRTYIGHRKLFRWLHGQRRKTVSVDAAVNAEKPLEFIDAGLR